MKTMNERIFTDERDIDIELIKEIMIFAENNYLTEYPEIANLFQKENGVNFSELTNKDKNEIHRLLKENFEYLNLRKIFKTKNIYSILKKVNYSGSAQFQLFYISENGNPVLITPQYFLKAGLNHKYSKKELQERYFLSASGYISEVLNWFFLVLNLEYTGEDQKRFIAF